MSYHAENVLTDGRTDWWTDRQMDRRSQLQYQEAKTALGKKISFILIFVSILFGTYFIAVFVLCDLPKYHYINFWLVSFNFVSQNCNGQRR